MQLALLRAGIDPVSRVALAPPIRESCVNDSSPAADAGRSLALPPQLPQGRREVAVELKEMEHSLLSHLQMIDGLLCCCACGPKRQQLQQWERVRRRLVA